MELSTTQALAFWIEGKRAGWVERGVGVLEWQGATVMGRYDDGKILGYKSVFVGKNEDCAKAYEIGFPDPEKFLPIDVTDEMGVEHCQILIENAVEQVAGR